MPKTEDSSDNSTSTRWGKATILGLSAAGVVVLAGTFLGGVALAQVNDEGPRHSAMREGDRHREHLDAQSEHEGNRDRDHHRADHDGQGRHGIKDSDMHDGMPLPERQTPPPTN